MKKVYFDICTISNENNLNENENDKNENMNLNKKECFSIPCFNDEKKIIPKKTKNFKKKIELEKGENFNSQMNNENTIFTKDKKKDIFLLSEIESQDKIKISLIETPLKVPFHDSKEKDEDFFNNKNKDLDEIKRDLNRKIFMELNYNKFSKNKNSSFDEILKAYFPKNLKLNFEMLRKNDKSNNSKKLISDSSTSKNKEFCLDLISHLKRNYLNDRLIEEKTLLNNSSDKNTSRIINYSICKSSSEAYFDNLPNLNSDFTRFDYKTSEILNEIFDMYEENIKIGITTQKNKRAQLNNCVPLSIGIQELDKANPESFEDYIIGMCGSQNKNLTNGRKTIKNLIESNDTQNLQTQETNNELLSQNKTKLSNINKIQAVDMEKKTISNDTKINMDKNQISSEINSKKEEMCLIS